MKKTLLSLAVMLGLGASFMSCSDDNQAAPGNDGNVTFNVAVPGSVLSRADFGDGTTAQNNVAYYVYDQADAATPVLTGTVPMSNLKGTLTLSLANSHTYDVVFLATAATSPYTYDATTRQMSVEYSDVATSDENLDAFYAVVADLKVSGPAAQDVKLYRPFAQLNIGTSDKAEYEASTGTTLSTTSVSVTGVYSAFDLMAGDVTGPTTDVTFKAAALPEGQTFPVSVDGKAFTYLSMDYLLVNQAKDIVEVALDVTNSAGTVEHKEYSNIPVQRNYRTNIYGALLTDEQMFNVEIVPGFGDPDYDISIEPAEPVKDASGVYLVKTQGELAWLAQQVNGGNMMSNATFSLQNDIYMQGKWTPIGGGGLDFGKRFGGTFLGNGHTIYDMVVDVNERAGFFGFLNGKVEDLNFDNASVTSNHWAGVVAGFSDNETGTCWIKNCKVANSTVTLAAEQIGSEWDNGDKGGAIIGYMAARDQVENCQVTNCTIQGYRDLGGVIGYSNGSVIRNNVVDGITIYVDNSHNYKNYTTLGQGGNDAQAVIGENAGGTDEGNSSSNVTIVGLVADGVTMDADGNYVINAPAGLVWMASQVNEGVNNFRGKMVKLGADLDMAGVAYEPCGNVLGYPTTTFCGSFDGCNHTIANLTASSIGEEGYAAAGLFGSSVGPIKNVTLTNVNIRSTHYAGAVCGFSSTNVGFVIENCHVDGGSVVSAAEQIGGEWDNGDKVGGIIGYTVVGDQILDCSVKNITVQGYRDLGGLVGYSGGATITGNTVENVKVLVDNSHNYKNYTTIGKGGNDAGEIIGEIASAGHDSNNSATGVIVKGDVADGVSIELSGAYLLSSPAGLQWLAQQANASDSFCAGKTFKLDSDIDLAGETVKPIRLWSPENTPTFDGCGHTVRNLTLGADNPTLFSSMTGSIKNINFENIRGTVSKRFSGVVGSYYGVMDNVHVDGIVITSTEGRVGVLVGLHNGGKLVNCSVKNADVTGSWSVGGLVGGTNERAVGYYDCTVENVKVINTHGFGGVYDDMVGVMSGNINKAGIEFVDCKIVDCGDHVLPIDHSFNDYMWNGTLIKADIEDN